MHLIDSLKFSKSNICVGVANRWKHNLEVFFLIELKAKIPSFMTTSQSIGAERSERGRSAALRLALQQAVKFV